MSSLVLKGGRSLEYTPLVGVVQVYWRRFDNHDCFFC